MSSPTKQLYEFGPFRLDPSEHTLWRDGCSVQLRPKVFDILLVLVERHGHLVEKEELMRAIWPEQFVEEGNLNKNISMLRQALVEGGGNVSYIETVPKRGYRFTADVTTVNGKGDGKSVSETHISANFIKEETEHEPSAMDNGTRATGAVVAKATMEPPAPVQHIGKSERRLKGRTVLAVAALILMLAAIVYLFSPRGGGEAINSVAVLPFVSESGDPEAEYLSDGISESLINSLSQLPQLKVTASSSSFKYRGKEVDLQEVARALGVQAILTGRVAQRGENLLISVELVDARDKTHIWGEQYNRRATDLLQVQSEISEEIARKLRLRLTASEQNQLVRRETVNPQAYELLLKGRFYWNKGGTENRKKAVDYYRQAIVADSTYALAYAELSIAYSDLVNNVLVDPKEFSLKAEDAAHKALELDDNLTEAQLAMARIRENAWDWAEAEREHKRAIELNPHLSRAHIAYAFYLIIQGRHEQALAEAKRARELDPLSLNTNTVVVYGLLLMRQNDEAVEAAKKMLELSQSNPNVYTVLAQTYMARGQYREAIAACQQAIKLGDDSPDAQISLGGAYAKVGEPEKTRTTLKRLENGKEYVSPMNLAILHIALGEREQALALLERAYSAHDQQLIWLGVEAEGEGSFAPLRDDPHFQELLRRIGLAASSGRIMEAGAEIPFN